ncbi:MAG TPA: YtxH domain-containing protein [Herpetosiphonaceae bacterium]
MKFIIGLLVGAGAGVAATLLLANKSEDEGLAATIQSNVQGVLASAKAAAAKREQELWQEFHERVPSPEQPLLG